MKNIFKKFITSILALQVRRLRKKRSFKLVAVAGSIGKTSTKFAIANVLSAKYRVQYQAGNYNDVVTVPLVFFGLPLPSLKNPLAWLITFMKIEWQLRHPYPYDVVVVELGTDGPGQLARDFGPFIHADIGVLTAIAPEHMEFFGTLDAVAEEELTIGRLADMLVLNSDLVEPRFMPVASMQLLTYGMQIAADYRIEQPVLSTEGYHFSLTRVSQELLTVSHPSVAVTQLYSIAAAAAVGDLLDMTPQEIVEGIGRITPVPGRMQVLGGIKGAVIIDETYNASPEAVKSALTTLYALPGKQKIALLGNMNELGTFSSVAHSEVGAFCDPAKLSAVVTLGPDANTYLAPAAEKRGCTVYRAESPYEAATKIKEILQDEAVILAKGSQNKVFAEEAVKMLLQDPKDAAKLVRQSKSWMAIKRKQFKDFPL